MWALSFSVVVISVFQTKEHILADHSCEIHHPPYIMAQMNTGRDTSIYCTVFAFIRAPPLPKHKKTKPSLDPQVYKDRLQGTKKANTEENSSEVKREHLQPPSYIIQDQM